MRCMLAYNKPENITVRMLKRDKYDNAKDVDRTENKDIYKKTDLHGNVVTHSNPLSHTSEATSSLLHACRQASNIVQSFPCMYARSRGLEQ